MSFLIFTAWFRLFLTVFSFIPSALRVNSSCFISTSYQSSFLLNCSLIFSYNIPDFFSSLLLALLLLFFFLLYNIVLVLPYINMNLPRVYMCSQSWTPLPPSSPYHPSGSSQCTSPKHPVSCIEPGLAIHFLHDIIHVSMPFSQIIPPSPSPTESKRLFYTCVSLLLSHIQGYHYHLSKISQFFASGNQSIGVSTSASVLPMNTQDWSPSEWTGWISLQSKGLSRVFSNTTAQKHKFFGTQPSSQSNSHIHTWPLEKP